MAVTLDSGAISAFHDALVSGTHPLRSHVRGWTKDSVPLICPPVVWAEFWRGRGQNLHFLAKVRQRVRVEDVTREDAELAVDALHAVFGVDDADSVKHLIDALVMAQAHRLRNVVYTADVSDLERLFAHFAQVKAIFDATGDVVCER